MPAVRRERRDSGARKVAAPTLVLGVDPGKRTGLALLRPRHGQPWECVASWTVPLERVPLELTRGVVAAACPKDRTVAALETWRAMGARKIRGLAHQAYASGVAWSALRIAGIETVTLDRQEILRAAGLRNSCDKARVARWLPRLVTAGRWLANEHERDAALAGFIGGGRIIASIP